MRLILRPRVNLRHGQDFLIDASINCPFLGLRAHDRIIRPDGTLGKYPECPPDTKLIIAHELHHSWDANFVEKEIPNGVPVVAHFHLKWSYCGPAALNNLKTAVSEMRITDGIVPARSAARNLPEWMPDNIQWHVVHYGRDQTIFHPSSMDSRRLWRTERGLDPNAFVGIWTSNFTAAKGGAIIHALLPLLKKHNIHLMIETLATAEDRQKLKGWIEQAEGHLIVPSKGETERPVIFCDFSLQTSYSEQAPLVVIESLLSGVPVVATQSTGFYDDVRALEFPEYSLSTSELPEAFKNYQWTSNGAELEPVDARGIAGEFVEKLSRIRNYPDSQREVLARHARLHFSEVTMLKKFQDIYAATEKKAAD